MYPLPAACLPLLLTSWTAKSFARLHSTKRESSCAQRHGGSQRSDCHRGAFGAGDLDRAGRCLRCARRTCQPSRSAERGIGEYIWEIASIAGLLSGLVVTQIALSLLSWSRRHYFLRTLRNISSANPGFEQDHILNSFHRPGYRGLPQMRKRDPIRQEDSRSCIGSAGGQSCGA